MNKSTFDAALEAREVASAYFIANPRVTLIDVGWQISDQRYTGELAVRIHVQSKPTAFQFESLSIEAPHLIINKEVIPFPVVDIIEADYPMQSAWNLPRVNDLSRAAPANPLRGGVSVSGEWLFGYGTLGGIVEDRDTSEKMILSNWHVLAASEYARAGTRIFQPGYGDYGRAQHTVAVLTRHAFAQDLDAAVAALTGARGWTNDQLELGPVSGMAYPQLGMQVVKSGRASRVTHGIIDGIEGDYPLYYGGMLRRIRAVHRIVPVNGLEEVSRAGDSGSWWLDNQTRSAVGLHFAGQDWPERALAMSMPVVLDALNVRIASDPLPQPAPEHEVFARV